MSYCGSCRPRLLISRGWSAQSRIPVPFQTHDQRGLIKLKRYKRFVRGTLHGTRFYRAPPSESDENHTPYPRFGGKGAAGNWRKGPAPVPTGRLTLSPPPVGYGRGPNLAIFGPPIHGSNAEAIASNDSQTCRIGLSLVPDYTIRKLVFRLPQMGTS
ncbi:hypothetical protein C8R44DRAFT_738990 [Mycena epipterygia]|nr:hypothetical protein C8R44DRAFT_738990 [Mycena epipterygia]